MEECATENPTATSAIAEGHFPLQARTDLRAAFAYLQARERADYYQAIVRVFLGNARRYYRIYLSAEQIADEVAAAFVDYSVEKCRADLDQLEAWGNVVKTFDTAQRHTSIESFLHPTVLYRATPVSLEIEETFLRLEGQTETVGELRRGDLDHLIELFAEVDRLVRAPGDESSDAVLAETWRRLSDQARTILDNTSKYIHTLAIARQEAASSELEGYLRYKQQVVAYVQDFALALQRASSRLQRYFRDWEESGLQERIVGVLAAHGLVPLLQDPTGEERRLDALRQLGAVADWFRGPDWAEYFGRAARHEVNAVLQRAQLLAATSHLGAGFLVDLESLARQLLRADDVESAARTTAVAFAHTLPRVFPERLAPSADASVEPWLSPAPLRLALQPIQRGGGSGTAEAAPIRDWREGEALRQAALARRQERIARLERLFGPGERELAALPLDDADDALLTIEVIRHCLLSPGYRWRADDGATIVLLNPGERRLATAHGGRSRFLLPRYRFRREALGQRSGEVARVARS